MIGFRWVRNNKMLIYLESCIVLALQRLMKCNKTNLLVFLLIISCFYGIYACNQRRGYHINVSHFETNNPLGTAESFNTAMIDSAITMLKDGDMVLRTGADVTSYMLSQTNQHDKTFSHCGLVRIENGYPFVYHAIGGEDNPDEEVRRDSASAWFSPAGNLGLGIARFNLNSKGLRKLTDVVTHYYKEKRKFDMKFDLATDNRLYCAELVYKALLEASGNKLFCHPVSKFGYHYISVENLYRNKHTKLIWQVRYK